MHFLLSNDDGYLSEGLSTLAEALRCLGRVTVVAPDRDRSGASNSLTLTRPLHATRMPNGYIQVDGTPTDCVHLALTGLLQEEPDMVIAGINHGSNLGDDVLYSGTVAAAMEGRFLGLPAIAISAASFKPSHLDTAATMLISLIRRLCDELLPRDTILNVNVPDLPLSAIKGFRATRLGNRHRAENMVKATDPRGRTVYWVGQAGPEQDAGKGTDFHAIGEGYVSVTPIKIDLTRHEAIESLQEWLQICRI